MNATPVRNPIRYCAALIDRLQRGEFQPELGLEIAERRHAERRREVLLRADSGIADTTVRELAGRLPHDLRAPLERMRSRLTSAPADDASHASAPDDSDVQGNID